MNSREKAIKALKDIGNVIEFSDCGEWDYNAIKYTHKEEIEIMAEQLNQPTLDDAIAVVEDIKHVMAKTYSIVCETKVQKAIAKTVYNVLEDILTALKG